MRSPSGEDEMLLRGVEVGDLTIILYTSIA